MEKKVSENFFTRKQTKVVKRIGDAVTQTMGTYPNKRNHSFLLDKTLSRIK